MDYALQPHLYKNVPVYLWPWVWWQLFQIERWIKATGRMVLGGVARDGKVYVLHVADDPNKIKPWSPSAPVLTPWNRVPDKRRDLVRLVTGIAFDPTRHGDQLMLAMRLLEWPLMHTCAGHNEPSPIAPPAQAQPPPTVIPESAQWISGTQYLRVRSSPLWVPDICDANSGMTSQTQSSPLPPSRSRAPGLSCCA